MLCVKYLCICIYCIYIHIGKHRVYIYLNIYTEYIHIYCTHIDIYIVSISRVCIHSLCVCMSVYMYLPLFFFFGRLHTDTIIPSFLSNPRLGSPDRQPRESILCRSRQQNHHVAAPHSRSNTRWDPQVWLYPANGAAEPAVSSCA